MLSFTDFLTEGNRAEQAVVPYLLGWVKMFKTYTQSSAIDDSSMNDFLHSLNGRYPPERLLQAKRALQLYSYYRARSGKSTAERPGVPPSAHDCSSPAPRPMIRPLFLSWDAAQQSITRTMRLRHLSLRTEKAYLSWIRQFKAYVAEKPCGRLTEEDLKSFLSFLAVERKVAAATQRLAFNALLFFFRNILRVEIIGPWCHRAFQEGFRSFSPGKRSSGSSPISRGRPFSWRG